MISTSAAYVALVVKYCAYVTSNEEPQAVLWRCNTAKRDMTN